ncbi:hypothetical protein Y032_0134g1828 [Ancylostoma ceylanicum]|uniref:Uncharacterized protein n=1 Tax=Ancylostoma ceylanicum TaxID=53326 RepID=A0A016T5X7_9BILA|nr:hypothetical protein Y032_0134g1828 [Ancylostoma ceylanicum]
MICCYCCGQVDDFVRKIRQHSLFVLACFQNLFSRKYFCRIKHHIKMALSGARSFKGNTWFSLVSFPKSLASYYLLHVSASGLLRHCTLFQHHACSANKLVFRTFMWLQKHAKGTVYSYILFVLILCDFLCS